MKSGQTGATWVNGLPKRNEIARARFGKITSARPRNFVFAFGRNKATKLPERASQNNPVLLGQFCCFVVPLTRGGTGCTLARLLYRSDSVPLYRGFDLDAGPDDDAELIREIFLPS